MPRESITVKLQAMQEEAEAEDMVLVDCPSCLNANRAARRLCPYCDHTGKALKRF